MLNLSNGLRLGIWVFILAALTFLTLNKHSRSGIYNYHSEIFGDKAGYYVYLPAAINFSFNANEFPSKIDSLTGNGFQLNRVENKIYTKYTYGVALLQLPFYLSAKAISSITNVEDTGFGVLYHKAIDFSAIMYFFLALYLLFQTLKLYFKPKFVTLGLTSIFLGTNIFFYTIVETGMSHVYSFFLIACLIAITSTLKKRNFIFSTQLIILFALTNALIILIRPTNIILLFAYFFLFSENLIEIKHRLIAIFQPKVLLVSLGIGIIIFFPQLVYWKLTYGSLFMDTYTNEGFNWFSPKFLSVLFAPKNGLFLYGSLYLLIVYAIFQFKNSNIEKWFYILLFFTLTYISASWWSWSFGCAYGGRNFTEYLAIFSIPFIHFLQNSLSGTSPKKYFISFVIFLMVVLNLKLVYSYDHCFFGDHDWDWSFYFELITKPTI